MLLALASLLLVFQPAHASPGELQKKDQPNADIPEKVKAQKWRVVRIAVRRKEGFVPQGTGFILVKEGKAFVITNAHVTRGLVTRFGNDAEIWANFEPPVNAHRAWIVETDEVNDFAILRTNVEFDDAPDIQTDEPKVGMTIFTLGYNDEHGEDLLMQKGRVVLTAPWSEEQRAFLIDRTYRYPGETAPAFLISGSSCRQGASGSPVFDEIGRIIGYLKGSGPEGMCLCISVRGAVEKLRPLPSRCFLWAEVRRGKVPASLVMLIEADTSPGEMGRSAERVFASRLVSR